MKVLLVVLLICIYQTLSKIVYVSQIYRHGARTPQKNIYDGKDQPHGRLTGVGMRQQYTLGNLLRSKYIDEEKVLSKEFNFDEIAIQSTDVDRTLQSCTSNLLGFYPMGTGQNIYQNVQKQYLIPPYKGAENINIGQQALPFKYQPPPIHTTTGSTDFLLYPKCNNMIPMLASWLLKPKNILNVKQLLKTSKPTLEEARKLLNNPKLQVYDLPYVYDVLVADAYQGRVLPEGFSFDSEFFKNLQFFQGYVSYYIQQDTEALNISNSNYFSNILENMQNTIDETSPLRWSMVSGHDSNLQNILPALNITSSQCIKQLYDKGETTALNCQPFPNFASNLLIELHQEQNEWFVKINYNGEYQNVCEREETQCSYEEFSQRLLQQIPSLEEINEVCKNNVNLDLNNKQQEIYQELLEKHQNNQKQQTSVSSFEVFEMIVKIILNENDEIQDQNNDDIQRNSNLIQIEQEIDLQNKMRNLSQVNNSMMDTYANNKLIKNILNFVIMGLLIIIVAKIFLKNSNKTNKNNNKFINHNNNISQIKIQTNDSEKESILL